MDSRPLSPLDARNLCLPFPGFVFSPSFVINVFLRMILSFPV